MHFSQKHIMKFLVIKRTWLSFKLISSTEKRNMVFTSNYTLQYPTQQLIFQRKTCVFLTKTFHGILTLSKERDYLQRKGTLFLLLNILCNIPNKGLSFQRTTCVFLTKAFHEILTHSKSEIIFKIKILQRRGTLFSLLTIRWHIQIKYFFFPRNAYACLTKAYRDILTL